jgi:hypothetical protein
MHQVEASTGATSGTGRHGILRRLGIYLLMIAWSVGGLAYTEVNSTHVVTFWLITTVLFAIIAIAHVYRSGAANRTSLALKQLPSEASNTRDVFFMASGTAPSTAPRKPATSQGCPSAW